MEKIHENMHVLYMKHENMHVLYMKARKHECFYVFSPFSAYFSPLHRSGKGSIVAINPS